MYTTFANRTCLRTSYTKKSSKFINLPNLSSPKLPHPIFLPTRKFGPTISTPDDELTECLPEYIAFVLRLPPLAPVAAADDAPGAPLE